MSAQIILHNAISHAAAAHVAQRLDLDVAMTRAGNIELRERREPQRDRLERVVGAIGDQPEAA